MYKAPKPRRFGDFLEAGPGLVASQGHEDASQRKCPLEVCCSSPLSSTVSVEESHPELKDPGKIAFPQRYSSSVQASLGPMSRQQESPGSPGIGSLKPDDTEIRE